MANKSKISKTYIYYGLGFPIELKNVEMVLFDGEYHPKIDVLYIADQAYRTLMTQKDDLSKEQQEFLRQYQKRH